MKSDALRAGKTLVIPLEECDKRNPQRRNRRRDVVDNVFRITKRAKKDSFLALWFFIMIYHVVSCYIMVKHGIHVLPRGSAAAATATAAAG